MGVFVVKTNELCSQCLYLNAIDMPDENVRATAIEINDLCGNCISNSKKLSLRSLTYSEKNIQEEVQKNSPFIKEENQWRADWLASGGHLS